MASIESLLFGVFAYAAMFLGGTKRIESYSSYLRDQARSKSSEKIQNSERFSVDLYEELRSNYRSKDQAKLLKKIYTIDFAIVVAFLGLSIVAVYLDIKTSITKDLTSAAALFAFVQVLIIAIFELSYELEEK